jgi:HAD superfamily hydrolase (TIGR01509 family)
MVHGVPEEPRKAPFVPHEIHPVEGVLFDFHGTIAQVEDAVEWVSAAAADCGTALDRVLATSLADRLVTAGRAGGPRPDRVPPHLAEVFAIRDLTSDAHRAAYTGLAATVQTTVDGLPEALYERVRRPAGWRVYADTVATMQALYEAAVPIAVVSNIGFDIRELCHVLGFARYVSSWALSFEVGRCKPDPAIFRHACRTLGVEPENALMVGDTPADAAAVDAGCRALVLPSSSPGAVHGLSAVLSLALPSPPPADLGRPVRRSRASLR